MTVIGTGISWTNSTWNPWVGCKAVSAGCEHCYAQYLVERRWQQDFSKVQLRLDRLDHVRRFRPIVDQDGRRAPHLVFVNSLSDLFFEQVSDEIIGKTLEVMEGAPDTIFQVLTKRQIRARKLLVDRYASSGAPPNIWFGVSAEDNRVAGRLHILRTIKERTGGAMTVFASVEPIVGPTDQLDFSGLDWVITGGESGPQARLMEREWLLAAVEQAQSRGIAIWHKQSGTIRSHPNVTAAPERLNLTQRFRWLVMHGFELLPQEKGGATIDKRTYRAFPPSYHALAARLNG